MYVCVRKYSFHLCIFAHFIMSLCTHFPDNLQPFDICTVNIAIEMKNNAIAI